MTHNLEVLEFISVPEELLSVDTYTGHFYYCIEDKNITNLAKYLFYIELEMYYDLHLKKGMYALQNLNPHKYKYENPNIFIGDSNRADYNYETSRDGDEPYLYHVLVDTNCEFFEKAMNNIRKSSFYKDEYIYKDLSTGKIVVRIYAFSKERINKCVRGDYSDLFKESNYKALKNPNIFYTYFNINFNTKRVTFKKESAILVGAVKNKRESTEADRLIESLGIDDDDIKTLLYNRHGHPKAELLN